MMQDTTEIPEKGSFLSYLYFFGKELFSTGQWRSERSS